MFYIQTICSTVEAPVAASYSPNILTLVEHKYNLHFRLSFDANGFLFKREINYWGEKNHISNRKADKTRN